MALPILPAPIIAIFIKKEKIVRLKKIVILIKGMIDNWDEYYKNAQARGINHVWGSEAEDIIKKASKYLPKKAKILELAAGEGKDSIYLAKKGFQVTAVDISKEAISRLEINAKKAHVEDNIRLIQSNLLDFESTEKFDVVIIISALHIFNKEEIKKVFEKINSLTKDNGYNIIQTMNVDDPKYSRENDDYYFFEKGELLNCYGAWKIIFYSELITEPEYHLDKTKEHVHGVSQIVARKEKNQNI